MTNQNNQEQVLSVIFKAGELQTIKAACEDFLDREMAKQDYKMRSASYLVLHAIGKAEKGYRYRELGKEYTVNHLYLECQRLITKPTILMEYLDAEGCFPANRSELEEFISQQKQGVTNE